jgi:hypothetical protein
MKSGASRRFQISDGLLLVAVTGLGLGGFRLWLSHFAEPRITLEIGISLCSILLFVWTTAILSLRLGANRPRRRRLWGEPGFLACVTVGFAYAWNAARMGLLFVSLFWTDPAQISGLTLFEAATALTWRILVPYFGRGPDIGCAILLVWLVAWASGRFRPMSNWIDRAGSILGAAWVALTFVAVLSK